MREITDHVATPADERIKITAMDEPGEGGANHYYTVDVEGAEISLAVHFQNGPIDESGLNGVTNEALLAIVIDRLRGLQTGSYACVENATALYHASLSLDWLMRQTEASMALGVEGMRTI